MIIEPQHSTEVIKLGFYRVTRSHKNKKDLHKVATHSFITFYKKLT